MQKTQDLNITEQEAQLICAVIDIASKRGAFGGQEMASIGTLFNKLTQELANRKKNDTAKTE
tara:strand:- start:278 stop:463 length:186 start_codon:yes stop_codon:yes gene_type:complete